MRIADLLDVSVSDDGKGGCFTCWLAMFEGEVGELAMTHLCVAAMKLGDECSTGFYELSTVSNSPPIFEAVLPRQLRRVSNMFFGKSIIPFIPILFVLLFFFFFSSQNIVHFSKINAIII